MTEVYLIRDAEVFDNFRNYINSDSFVNINRKKILTSNGEEKSKILGELPFLGDVDFIISSNYVRSMSTVKYLAEKLNKPIIIDERFDERIRRGSENIEEPEDFEIRQFHDENYKLEGGESRKEVYDRVYNALLEVLDTFKDNKVVIGVPTTTISTLLLHHWCEVKLTDHLSCTYNGKEILDGTWNSPEIFKLILEDKELIDIERLRPKELE
jgi:2,3-bisphosphoglycerate-dependent phosphoglycerate mutase